jgi:hypothetical protein
MTGMQPAAADRGTLAGVIPLAAVRETRVKTRKLAAACPGWRCWYSAQAGLWFGRRIAGRWIPETTGRTYVVAAADPAMLQAAITTQALLDLVIEFAGWEIECTSGGSWYATWGRPGDGRGHAIIAGRSAVHLAATLREYAASMDEPGDPRMVWWGDSDDD